ncbi:NAD(P)/FAD-dependent oxidoreductase [Chitinophaga pinensis]|uniref:FAD-dependent pyridine nucleotide-disulphide oxidoreductase n=1 Tax=Chitinophaga pinensis (strain ATCC 43595 / DSM 2588 / LMG 13176 / NBRC 15968 / NCIMB 11800 / UQM 2034) TaxID=485918 RepID=A0A979G537_CHIPD|nr:NAD(P)/FAD-dependent oxidoreductase [Chitinophaga pinensis]ACU60901.1 FAD-dependent pyridine nucleotide-disulphide oxidoreductase [Chitinophaga pinensis DSM 2588]
MTGKNNFDVIIIGGSYAGLAAAMSLGRALRRVLIIDSGKPCNRQTPHSHNFLTRDGSTPAEIAAIGKEQVLKYDTVQFYTGLATRGVKTETGFEIGTDKGDTFSGTKLIFATGITDEQPAIPGFAECWGISVIHCPYCHGYEVKQEKTGILANGDMAFDFGKLISNWTDELTIFTNGASTLTPEQMEKLAQHNIAVVEKVITKVEHDKGYVRQLVFEDGRTFALRALYARVNFTQHCDISVQLGCELTEQGYLRVDAMQKTTVPHVYACGDNSSMMRSVANAVSTGTLTGAITNKDLIDESF